MNQPICSGDSMLGVSLSILGLEACQDVRFAFRVLDQQRRDVGVRSLAEAARRTALLRRAIGRSADEVGAALAYLVRFLSWYAPEMGQREMISIAQQIRLSRELGDALREVGWPEPNEMT